MLLGIAYNGRRRYDDAVDERDRCRRLCGEHGLRTYEPETLLELGIAHRGRAAGCARWRTCGRARATREDRTACLSA
ncbi:hypothetical protein [Nonomuraea typhae]|uniref:hypothetical protein n=1 Tax=Nonomuraea typhae TaxID=2603600 RepID=UPI0012FB4A8C|nr:hypothetical protein [Nonomuraea typhae]